MPTPPTSFALSFVKKEQLTADTYSFYFDRTVHPFEFLPGQYIRMILMHPDPDERGTSRFFTIASSPSDHENLMITTRVLKSSFKKYLLTLLPGQEVQFWGPTGHFVLHETEPKPLVCIAGGIGITPYHSMLTYAKEMNVTTPITVFASFSSPDEVVFWDELSAVNTVMPNLKAIYTVTKPEESTKSWSGETGRISPELIKKYVPDIAACTYYISGPGAMVDAMENLVASLNVPTEQIIIEKFPGY